ncbi:hypothetical protein PBAL39_00772 [Pedobacter sp. BAL39]|uniref:hypothetical protein n=1 Tax=Pedobacter sp. BAL39 TaxID=391596 RepID=UPI0001559D9B|nr:hypothetical protein [Pedobacter sp. BAL39]EDM38103.1 hypothetical protein PBAL39_00772 [Pedobacter sp. BAL39]
MDRKKKKQASTKSAANVEQQRKALKQRFLDRTINIIMRVGGEVLLNKFTPIFLEKLYEVRYPVLKAKSAPGANIPKPKIIQFNKLLLKLIEEVELELPNGNKIPLSWYLSEGMTLSACIGEFDISNGPRFEEIKEAFSFCSYDSEFHRYLQQILGELTTDACGFLSDYEDHIYNADVSMTPYFAKFNPDNDIIIYAHKPEVEDIEVTNGKRKVIRMGWLTPDFEWEHFAVKSSLLGFERKGLDIPLELYFTTHTLKRLQERINIVPGIMHRILLLIFMQPQIPHHWKRNYSLVEYRVSDQKVGYLVVKLHGTKLVVHTFLFLTNNDTPEGEKLGRLLGIVKEDKKYMEIDTLPDFNSYHFEKNEKLNQLFKDAGCGPLLKLGHLKEFATKETADKDSESIERYLDAAVNFRERYYSDTTNFS